jgi:prephenate dehydrogenase
VSADVLVVGCGLIGASVALALRQSQADVLLSDRDRGVVDQAAQRGAGRAWDGREGARVALIAVPPGLTARVRCEVQSLDLATTYTHVASVQSQVQREIEALSPDLSAVVGGHPLAGRERSGPSAAAADLFVGRPWAVCAGRQTSDRARADLMALIQAVGADPVELSAEAHDASVAVLSHLPQLVSSALAGALTGEPGLAAHPERLRLAGPGVVDTTRLAASDPELWVQILELNARELAPVARRVGERLVSAAAALDDLGAEAGPAHRAEATSVLRAMLRDGNAGRALVPVKRGVREDAFAPVRVTVSDEPGRLAALLTDAGGAGVNVEDVHVEHVPGRPTGVIELLVARADIDRLGRALTQTGWLVLAADNPQR